MTNYVGHGPPGAYGAMAAAQRMTALGVSLPASQFGTGSWRQHGLKLVCSGLKFLFGCKKLC